MLTLEQLEKMEAREIDVMVTQRVMGWTYEKQRPSNAEGFRDGDGDFHVVSPGYEAFANFWNPSTDPAADYSVLQHVREKWVADEDWKGKRRRFSDALAQMYDERGGVYVGFDPAAYLVGDYSKAALLALAEQENSK